MTHRALIRGLEIQEAVTADGLPRVADADDGTQDVMYLADGASIAQSMSAAEWLATRGPLPTDPTPAQIQAAIDARAALLAQRSNEVAQLRVQVLAIAQSAVGLRVDALTSVQLRALFAAVLWDMGALNPDLTVRALREWVDR